MDILLNRWLLYQTLACRVWARSGLLPGRRRVRVPRPAAGRDRPADGRAATSPASRSCCAASRQFAEGDVQHWWHPPSGRGVRTRISDDLLWLPYAVDRYRRGHGRHDRSSTRWSRSSTGRRSSPTRATSTSSRTAHAETGSLYEHCAAAIDVSLALGAHGLPLMGSGDWNDGMNRVGARGPRRERLARLVPVHACSPRFAPIAEARGDAEHAAALAGKPEVARAGRSERHGWDGDWYRRAYFDDGTPLGSADNDECRIDSIAQSWSVLSGGGRPDRARAGDGRGRGVPRAARRRARPAVHAAVRPHATSIRATSRAICRASGRTAGSTRTARSGRSSPSPALGDGDKAGELFSMLNPINHASTRAGVHRYKVEPYVVAADVYAEPPHVGRGGWTWYTGSAGWMYRAGVEWILGFRLRGTSLVIDPCIPRAWPSYEITFRYRSARYEIVVENPAGVSRGVASTELDGVSVESAAIGIALVDDGATHRVRIVLG